MPDDRPVSRCRVRGCPVIGHWHEGELCPMHRHDPDYEAAPVWEDD